MEPEPAVEIDGAIRFLRVGIVRPRNTERRSQSIVAILEIGRDERQPVGCTAEVHTNEHRAGG
jgi:hypothetical protein